MNGDRSQHTVEREFERGTTLGCSPFGGADTFQLVVLWSTKRR